jgi:type IV pilus assembly protein PilC
MPEYKYKAINAVGKTIEGIQPARSKEEVLQILRSGKSYPVSVVEHIHHKDVNILEVFDKVKLKDISIFCRQFHAMMNAGVSIINCLDILRQQTENKKMGRVIEEVYEQLQKGMALSDAMKKHEKVFPELLVNMIAAGEASGNLDTILDRMAIHYEKENKISAKVRGAMIYPMVVSSVAVVVVILMLVFVFPTFIDLFGQVGAELPLQTRIVMAISNFIQAYWYILILAAAVAVYFIRKAAASDSGRLFLDQLKFRIPVLKGTTSKIITSRFARTLSTLLGSGMPLLQSLELVSKVVGNKVAEKGILMARDEVRKGVNLAVPIKKIEVFPPMLISMLSVGEESGSLDEILEKTANFYDSEVETSIETLTKLLEPLMLVFMAIIIGFIAIAMVLPMFDLMNKIN